MWVSSCPVDVHVYDISRVGLELQPGAAVGDYGRAGSVLPECLCHRSAFLATVRLADDDSLSPIDDERAGFGHQRKSPMNLPAL